MCIQLDGIEDLECEFDVAMTTIGSAKAGESIHSCLTVGLYISIKLSSVPLYNYIKYYLLICS